MGDRDRRRILLLLPPVLIAGMCVLFPAAARALGRDVGYLVGFAVYWALCLGIPSALLGPRGTLALLKPATVPGRSWVLPGAVFALVVLGALASYGAGMRAATAGLLLIALPVGAFNGVCEELLWRGLYAESFASRPVLAVLYPSLWFGAWHVAPQLVFPSPGGVLILALSAGVLGLAYGWMTLRTGSARWAAVSHAVSGIIATGGAIAPAVLRVLHVS